MIRDLFINSMILISFISLSQQLLRDKGLNYSSQLYIKVLAGLTTGFLGILLMSFSVRVNDNVLIDFRYIPVILASIFGGPIPIIISCLIIGIFRLIYFELSVSSIVVSSTSILMGGIGFSIISILKISIKQKWIYSVVYLSVISGTVLGFLFLKSYTTAVTPIIYVICNVIMSFLVYKYVQYLVHLTKLYRKFKNESSTDFLTGLNNVRNFDLFFNTLTTKVESKGERLSLLYIDIDFFKKVNDTYGHSNGNIVLSELGTILSKTCRSFDFISRNGGEEFTVLLLDCASKQALEIAEKLRKTIEKYNFVLLDGEKINITVSIGVATYPDTTTDIHTIIKQADSALYVAKCSGRNKVILSNMIDDTSNTIT